MIASGNTNNTITYMDLTIETNLSRWAAYCFILDPSSFPNWKALSRFIYMWMMTAIYLCKFSNFNYQSRAAFWHRAGNWAKSLAQSPARCIWFQIRTSKKRKILTTRNKIKTITKRSTFACEFRPRSKEAFIFSAVSFGSWAGCVIWKQRATNSQSFCLSTTLTLGTF